MDKTLVTFDNNPLNSAVLQRLKEGETPYSVAVWVQQDLLELTDMPTNELAKSIKHFYITKVPLEDRMRITKSRNSIRRTVERQRGQTSALEEMITLYFLQKGRIELAHQEELLSSELRQKMRENENFEAEVENLLEELEEENSGKGRKKKKSGYDENSLVIFGTLDNTIETARRLLMDIHKMRQDLDLDPRQVDKVKEESISPDFAVKRAKIVQKAVKKLTTPEGYDVEQVE